jgi:hypothetical protein
VIVALGATGVLGVESRTVRAAGGDLELAVRYPGTTRAGLPAAIRIQVTSEAPITEPVTIGITGSYLDLFDEQGVRPEPASSSSMGRYLVWEFDPPLQGRTLTIRVDVIMETGRHFGQDGRVVLLDDAGQVLGHVELDTRVVP